MNRSIFEIKPENEQFSYIKPVFSVMNGLLNARLKELQFGKN